MSNISLSLSLSESEQNIEANTSKVTAVLSLTINYMPSAISHRNFGHGYIIIDGTRYSFESEISKNKTITLATKSKTVTHDTDGSKTVSVKGWFRISSYRDFYIEKDITLTKFSKTHTVTYITNGGYPIPEPQTKIYGSSLKLSTIKPIKEGYNFIYWVGNGINYFPGSYYNYNEDVALKAIWNEHTATITYVNSIYESFTQTAKYSTEYKVSYPRPLTGFFLKGWSTNPDGSSQLYYPGQIIKLAKIDPWDITFYAVWEAESYNVTYNLNSESARWIDDPNLNPDYNKATYNNRYTFPGFDGILENSGYSFQGWSSFPSGQVEYGPEYSFDWNIDYDLTLYAKWTSVLNPVYYYRIRESENNSAIDFSDAAYYSIIYSEKEEDQPLKYDNYTVKDLGDNNPPDLAQYTFSGYWTLEKPSKKVYTEFGQSFPAAVIPYNYNPIFNSDNYSEEDNFFKPGYVIKSTDTTIRLYPVYRDNTPSTIENDYNTYEYVSQITSQKSYYLYLSKQINSFDFELDDSYVNVGFIYKSPIQETTLNYSNLQAKLVSLDDNSIEIELNPIFIRSLIDNNNYNIYYIICKNKDSIDDPKPLINSDKYSYRMEISGLKDVFGKDIPSTYVDIVPPLYLRDINTSGDVISLFSAASDYDENSKEHHKDNEFSVNGISLTNNLLLYDSDFKTTVENTLGNSCFYEIDDHSHPEYKILEYPDLIKILEALINKIQYLESVIDRQ